MQPKIIKKVKPKCTCGHADAEHEFDIAPQSVLLAILRGDILRKCLVCQCDNYVAAEKIIYNLTYIKPNKYK